MVVLQKVGQVELVAEQNGVIRQTPVGPWQQWQFAVLVPGKEPRFTPDRIAAGRDFLQRLSEVK